MAGQWGKWVIPRLWDGKAATREEEQAEVEVGVAG